MYDWWALRNYQPPTAVVALADETTMNTDSRRVFYVNRPQIQDKAAFYASCNENEQTIVLGCYIERKGIFLLHVSDERLNGVEQVTAAHEMLHAAYDRLANSEKAKINTLLNQEYSKLNDPSITEKINEYKKNGADVINELHSILGTEVADLSPELELYYRQYFTDRAKIAAYAKQYENVFISRKKQLEDYNSQLDSIEKQVVANNASLATQAQDLDAEKARLTELRNNGDIDSYNAGVAPYNSKLRVYNNLVDQTKQLVAEYKSILDRRNQLAVEAQELTKALDSRISTPDSK